MEVTINGVEYKTGVLPAYPHQFHVARKLAPALFAMGGVIKNLSEEPKIDQSSELEIKKANVDAMLAFGPVAEVIANMSDADAEYVLSKCLSVVLRKEGQQWAKITAPSGSMMYKDIDVSVMMKLAIQVVQENLGNFFQGSPEGTTQSS